MSHDAASVVHGSEALTPHREHQRAPKGEVARPVTQGNRAIELTPHKCTHDLLIRQQGYGLPTVRRLEVVLG